MRRQSTAELHHLRSAHAAFLLGRAPVRARFRLNVLIWMASIFASSSSAVARSIRLPTRRLRPQDKWWERIHVALTRTVTETLCLKATYPCIDRAR